MTEGGEAPPRPIREIIVGIGALAVSNDPDSALITHDLGSCVAVCVHDPVARVGGLLHYLLPLSTEGAAHLPLRPECYADTGVPMLFERIYALGGVKSRLRVRVAGGATIARAAQASELPSIGLRNTLILRKMFWQNQIIVAGQDTGGTEARSVRLDLRTGAARVTTLRGAREL